MRLDLTPELAAILFNAIEDAEYYRDIDEDEDDRDPYDTEALAKFKLLREALDRQAS